MADFAFDLDLFLESSSPEETFIDATAAFLARREAPLGPGLPFNIWPATGVFGRDVSGVAIGVASVEVTLLCRVFCGAVDLT